MRWSLGARIAGEWKNEFITGKDYDVLEGEDLRAFKQLATSGVASHSKSLLVLFESG